MSETSHPAGVPVCYRHPGREAYIRCQRCDRPICPDCMRDASVGFQCPECIADARRTTRQAKPFYGARMGFRAAPVTYTLIAINVAIWAIINLTGRYSSRLLDLFALRASGACASGGNYYPTVTHAQCDRAVAQVSAHWAAGVSDGAPWELLTSLFTHVEVWHIAGNMFSLLILGVQLEQLLGKGRYLAVYLLSGLAGSALVYWAAHPQDYTLGASGAIFGLMGAFAVFLLRARASLQPLLWTLVINFGITFAVPGISWQGHVGGFVGGAALGALIAYTGGVRRRPLQLGGFVGVGVIIVLAVVLRTATLA